MNVNWKFFVVFVPEVGMWRDHTPVLVDDIVSTARTMIETVGPLRDGGMKPLVCVAIHESAAAAMSLSSLSVVGNALRLRSVDIV